MLEYYSVTRFHPKIVLLLCFQSLYFQTSNPLCDFNFNSDSNISSIFNLFFLLYKWFTVLFQLKKNSYLYIRLSKTCDIVELFFMSTKAALYVITKTEWSRVTVIIWNKCNYKKSGFMSFDHFHNLYLSPDILVIQKWYFSSYITRFKENVSNH